MRHSDFTPLYRSTVGFDQLFQMLDTLSTSDNSSRSYPPYNIERLDDNSYRISMAVAGFSEEELSLETSDNTLVVKAENASNATDEKDWLYRGIASRNFERRFKLAEYVEVKSANLENGLLHITLEREVPEAMKPRRIEIGKTTPLLESEAA